MASSTTSSSDQLKWGDKRFVKKVAEGGQMEIALAQLAAERATNPDVKSFAQQLANDHQAMCQKLEQLAQSKGLQAEVAEYSVKMSNSSDMAAMHHSSSGSMNTTASMNSNRNSSGTTSANNSSYGSTSSGTGSGSSSNSGYSSTNTGSNGAGTTGSNSSINANSSAGSSGSGNMANNNSSTNRDRSGTVASSTSEYDRSTGADASQSTSATGSATMRGSGRMDKDNDDWNDPTKNRHYKHLANKTGADFDKEFISMMVSEHEDDIAMFTKESKKGDDAEVRSFAEGSLPKLQEHLNRAQQISSTLKS